jgi:glycosidase
MKISPDWIHSTNIYEVNTRQYTEEGTFNAFAKHLPRLQKMGVKVLWMMPITPISLKNRLGSLGSPYAAADYVSINPEFGTLNDFKILVSQAHDFGMYVIIDWVANHTGWDHIWTKTNPEFYKKTTSGDFKTAEGMADIIELDFTNQNLRTKMIESMKFWLNEAQIDGFRCDLASWVPLDFWSQARNEVQKIKPLFFLGEFDELENPDYGQVFDASYAWKWMHFSEKFVKEKLSISEFKNLLIEYSNLGDSSQRAWFTSNHDENSWNGTEYEKYDFLALPFSVFSLTWNGIPLIYSGQEIPNKKRLKFFDKDPINWNQPLELEGFYQKLLELKSINPALRGGNTEVSTYFINTNQNDKILAYLRKNGKDEVLVLLNLSHEVVEFVIDDENIKGEFQNIFFNEELSLNQKIEIGGFKVYTNNGSK